MNIGIKTNFLGRTFRSLLEAKWAAFFTDLGFEYEYEPFELDGWIPDFILPGKKDVLVEIKPHTKIGEYDLNKLLKAAPGRNLFVVGVSPFDRDGNGAIGWMNDLPGGEWGCAMLMYFRKENDAYEKVASRINTIEITHQSMRKADVPYIERQAYLIAEKYEELLRQRYECPGSYGINSEYDSYADIISGYYDGNPNELPYYAVKELWNKSSNRVQWKA